MTSNRTIRRAQRARNISLVPNLRQNSEMGGWVGVGQMCAAQMSAWWHCMHCNQTQNHLSNDQTGPLDPWTREVGDREAGHREVGDRQVGYREVGDQEVGEVGDLDPGPLKRRANAPFSACACFFSQSPAVSAVPTSRNSMARKVCEKSSNRRR